MINKYTSYFEQLSNPGLMKRIRIKSDALKSGMELSNDDINELYRDIDTQSDYVQLIIKAKKANLPKPETIVSDFFKLRNKNDDSLDKLMAPLLKAKKKNLDISAKDIIDLYGEDRPVPKIVDALIIAAGADTPLTIADIKTVWYNSKEFGSKVIELYTKSKKHYPKLSPAQFKILILQDINLDEFLSIVQMLKNKNLDIPFKTLSKLLSKRINIIKTIIILSKAKESCKNELAKHDLFSEKENDELANIYVVEGKEKFKKKLNNSLITNQILSDPVNLYFDLTRSEGKGFKINLETLDDYLGFEYDADINKVTGSYLKARKNKLHIKYKQIADMAQKKIDVERFIDAQIKSGTDE